MEKPKRGKLKGRRLKFAKEYLKRRVGKDAAIAAGYAEGSAANEASRLLKNKDIQAYMESFVNDEVVEMEWLIGRYIEIAAMTDPDGKGWKGSDVKGALDSLAKIKGLFLNKEQSAVTFQPIINLTYEKDEE